MSVILVQVVTLEFSSYVSNYLELRMNFCWPGPCGVHQWKEILSCMPLLDLAPRSFAVYSCVLTLARGWFL